MKQEALAPAVLRYASGVSLLGAGATVLLLIGTPIESVGALLLCAALFAIGEAITFETPTGRGIVSLAAMMHIAFIPVMGPATLALAVWCSRLPAELLLRRQAWYKAVFNAGQISLAMAAASLAFGALGSDPGGPIDRDTLVQVAPGLLAAMLIYYAINHGLVAGVITLITGGNYWTTWRENFGNRPQVVTSGAMFLTAPVATVVYQHIGVFGLVVFILPLLLIRDACSRYFALEATQRALIGSERLAAKGEMAASVAHELNNYLAVLNGNLQIIQMRGLQMTEDAHEAKIEKSLEQVRSMTTLSKGLMEFSRVESHREPTDVARLIEDAVEFLVPQNRFDSVMMDVECAPGLGIVTLDAAQMQQILMNLLNNASDAMRDADTPVRRIRVTLGLSPDGSTLDLCVMDSGPGIDPKRRGKIFEPGFTTKHDGHGFGLSTVYRIIQNHGGSIGIESAPEDLGGALFRVSLPATEEHRLAG